MNDCRWFWVVETFQQQTDMQPARTQSHTDSYTSQHRVPILLKEKKIHKFSSPILEFY